MSVLDAFLAARTEIQLPFITSRAVLTPPSRFASPMKGQRSKKEEKSVLSMKAMSNYRTTFTANSPRAAERAQ